MSKKLRVEGNKKDDVKVKDATKIKTMTVTNITKDTEDADVEKLLKSVGSIESLRPDEYKTLRISCARC